LRLLLHTCCAPCAIYPVNEAKKDNFTVTGFFCNSNIHPEFEYVKRKKAVKDFFESEGKDVFFTAYDMSDFFENVPGCENSAERCLSCWNMRLAEAASFAKKNRFDAFTTTLLGSPYQGHDAIKGICEELSRKTGVRFYYKDFRVGFRGAHDIARKKNMYRQKYCGCVFSMVEK